MRSRFFLLLTVLALLAVTPAGWAADEPPAAATLDGSGRSLDQWEDVIEMSSQSRVQTRFATAETATIPLDGFDAVAALGITGSGELHGDNSLIRLVLVGADDAEHLIYETYPLIAPNQRVVVSDACHDTCVLDRVVPASLRIELVDASFTMDAVSVAEGQIRGEVAAVAETVRRTQQAGIVELLNARIHELGLNWVAAETSYSRLTYAEKTECFASDAVINLQGLEYYAGGTFVVGSGPEAATASEYVAEFDWRTRHGATEPGSPYYDGDPAGSGWITPVKNQGQCGSCWAFAAVGALESVANLYFNEHVDLDLSEQEMVSCANCGSCDGGGPGCTLSHIAGTHLDGFGIVDEGCFPYTATDAPCTTCESPAERISLAGRTYVDPELGEDYIKGMLLEYGPLSFGIRSWWHCIVLVGWSTDADGHTEWIFKNSWGTGWGEDGYGTFMSDLDDIYLTYALHTPITSLIVPREVSCVDRDGDGYANWGLLADKPSGCPAGTHAIPDCDDSDPTLGEHAGDGSCRSLGSPQCTILGTSGRDVLIGTAAADVICGRGGDDIIYGNGGADTLRGGDGNDRIYGGWGLDWINGNEGDDRLIGGGGGDTILGGPGNDVLRGKGGNDQLEGNKGNDSLIGGPGTDSCIGGRGADDLLSCE